MKDRIKSLKRIDVSKLVPHPKNWRKHSKSQRKALDTALGAIGWADAIIARELPDGTHQILDGHLRKDVTTGKVPVLVVDLDDKEADMLLASHDSIGAMAGTDSDMLRDLLADLQSDNDAINEMLEGIAKTFSIRDGVDELLDDAMSLDDVDTIAARWNAKPGDIWEVAGIARHRLMCGDSTNADDVGVLFDGAKPFIMVTDPPYGVEYDPKWRDEADIGEAKRRSGVVANDERFDWTDAYKLFPGVVAYVWNADKFAAVVCVNLRSAGFEIRSQIIWSKPAFAISRGHYHWQHEPCWYATRKGSSKWCGDRSQSTVWEISNRLADDEGKTDHGTQKPIECMARPIRNHGGKSDAVYDPFCGSGTTMLAAERLGRQCFAMELSPQYVAVILQRMNDAGCECKLINSRKGVEV